MTRLLPLPSKAAWLAPFAAQLALLGLQGCGGDPKFGPEHAVDASKRPTVLGSTQRERFGLEPMGQTGADAAAAGEHFEGDAPAGWQLLPAAEMRELNYRVGTDGECYLTTRNVGGGMLANVNRWVSMQFGQPALTQQQFTALPRHVLLGQAAVIVEVEGTFKSMGSAAKEGFKLLGLVAGTDDDMQTLKFTGPRELVDSQREQFLAFAASIRRASGPAAHAAATGTGSVAASGFSATTPQGWQELPGADMRQLNWRVASDAECYLTAGGLRGGRLANVNRWVAMQFGQQPMAAADFDKLPKAKLLGADAVIVEVEGSFRGMGSTARDGFKLIGLVGGTDSDMVTLKMTGPKAVVDQQRAAFLQLAASIQRGGQPPRAPTAPAPPANGAANPHAGDAAAPFTATIPAGWTAAGDTGSKLLRHRFGTEGDCYVGMLGNELPALLGIWCGDLGAKAPDAAAIAALPKVPMLGGEAVLLDVSGDYKSMSGQTIAGARLLIAARQLDGGVTFAKCIGPAAEVDAQRAAFLAFVASLKRTGQ